MERKAKINIDKNNHIIQKKIYQNPFKKDTIYKTNKIKLIKISKTNKENLLMNSNTRKKLSQISTERNITNQSLKKDTTMNYLSSINITSLNKTNFPNKRDRKVANIDFKKSIAAKKQLTDTKNYGDNTQETKNIFEKIKRKNIFGISSNNFRNKNDKFIKINNTESTLNLLNTQNLRYLNKPKLQNYNTTIFKKLNLNINYSNKNTESKRYLKEKISHNDNKNISNFKNNLMKSNKIYKSDVNILKNRTKNINKSKNNKKLDNSNHIKNNQNIIINHNKIKKESLKILQTEKKISDDIIKGFSYSIIANNKSANTKPTNISSFIISEKKIEKNDNINNYNKIQEKSSLKNSYFKEHMKFIDLNKNQIKILVDNYNKTKESDSKFLNYELGQTNGLSLTDSIFYSLENSCKNENNKHKLIECEHSIEYMEKFAKEFLNSNKNLSNILKDKNIKDSYYDIIDNNLSSLDEFKNGEDIHRIINLQINLKK